MSDEHEQRSACSDGEIDEQEGRERRAGLPDEASVVAEETLISPKGRRYRILKTRETDAYDELPEGDETPPSG
jgi:hypothetical protein